MSALVAITGQSLALGFRLEAADLPAGYAPTPLIQILVGDHFEVMVPGLNTGTPANPEAWGPEVGIAVRWEQDHPGEVLYVVKSVKGSTGLAEDPHELDWSPASREELFDVTSAKVAVAKALTGLPLQTIYFVQGQQDATVAAKADAYGVHLADLIHHARDAWGSPATEFVVAEVSDHSGLPYAAAVRAGEVDVVSHDPHAVLVTSDGETFLEDSLHLDGRGEFDLGERLYGAAYTPPVDPDPDLIPHHGWFSHFGRGLIPSEWVFQVAALIAGIAWAAEHFQGALA